MRQNMWPWHDAAKPSILRWSMPLSPWPRRKASGRGLEQERVWDSVLSMEPEQSPLSVHGRREADRCGAGPGRLRRPEIAFAGRPFAQSSRVSRTDRSKVGPFGSQRRPTSIVPRWCMILASSQSRPFILNKPQDTLTEAEREQVRLHPYHSERILSKVPALEPIIPSRGSTSRGDRRWWLLSWVSRLPDTVGGTDYRRG